MGGDDGPHIPTGPIGGMGAMGMGMAEHPIMSHPIGMGGMGMGMPGHI